MNENQISKVILDAAIEVHREIGGPGLIEDLYEEALEEELKLRGIAVQRQIFTRVTNKGKLLRKPLRLDMKVENLVLVENKAVTEWNPIFDSQMLTCLRVTRLKLGLIINFGERHIKHGFKRIVNGLPEDIDFRKKPTDPLDVDQV